MEVGSSSGQGCLELLPELSIVLTEYPEEKRKRDQTHRINSHMINGEETKIRDTEASVAACQKNMRHR